MRHVLEEVGPFDAEECSMLAFDINPQVTFPDTEDDYVCFNCGDVVVHGARPTSVGPEVLLQCASCTALNHFPHNDQIRTTYFPPKREPQPVLHRLSTAYRNPLNITQTHLLGQFSAAWGQIDELITACIAALLNTDLETVYLLLESQTSGPRINFLRRLTSISDLADVQTRGREFCKSMGPLIEKRNHLMHGIWGYCIQRDGKPLVACQFKKSSKPIYATELAAIAQTVMQATYDAELLLFAILKHPGPPAPKHPESTRVYLFGEQRGGPPWTWLCKADPRHNPPDRQSPWPPGSESQPEPPAPNQAEPQHK